MVTSQCTSTIFLTTLYSTLAVGKSSLPRLRLTDHHHHRLRLLGLTSPWQQNGGLHIFFFIQTYDIRHLLFSPWHPHSGPTSMIDLPGSRVMACRFPLYQGGIASITLGKGNLRLGIGHYYECLQATSDWSLASIDDPIFTPCSSAPFIWTCPPIQRMFRILLSRFHIGGKGILQLNNNSIISILGFRKRSNLFRTNCEML